MRKLIKVVIATIVIFLLWPSPASAQEEAAPAVNCTMLRFVDPSLADENGAFPTNTPVEWLADLEGDTASVAQIIWTASMGQKGGIIDDTRQTRVVWTQPYPGTWTIMAQLYDTQGNEIIPTGDCDGIVTFADTSNPDTKKVDCTMQVHANKDQLNGGYVTGEPISFELYVPKAGPMQWFFIASRDGGTEYELNDGMDNKLMWTPTEAGTYTIRGKFIASKSGEELEVLDPERCRMTFVVRQAQAATPQTITTIHPVTTTVPSEATTSAPSAAPAVLASTSAPAAELPRTGPSSIFVQAMIGFGLIIIGTVLNRKYGSRLA